MLDGQAGYFLMSEPKLCPYRIYYAPNTVNEAPSFALCLQDKCAMWRVSDFWNPAKSSMRMDADGKRVIDNVSDHAEYCGLAGKP